jgi:hypothetical protein
LTSWAKLAGSSDVKSALSNSGIVSSRTFE